MRLFSPSTDRASKSYPRKKTSYNDDVNIPHYTSSARVYAGKQRKGLQTEHLETTSMLEHVQQALTSPFFLALETPLPPALSKALDWVASSPTTDVLNFWDNQLQAVAQLAKDSLPIDLRWNRLIPSPIKQATGQLRLAPLRDLASQFNLGGGEWLTQFLFGFPLIGKLCQRFTFPTCEKANRKKLICTSKIKNSSGRRFRERASKSGFKNATPLWDEATLQVDKGWLTAPFPLASTSEPHTLKFPELNIAFRFGVEQADKLRACDDLCHSRTNLACKVLTPIKLVSWDHLAEMCRRTSKFNLDWHFFKADHEAAYKQLPLNWEHSSLAVIALRSPKDNRWYGFMSRTLMFGAIAAVIHYNVFSRLLAELTCKIFGIPIVSYFDDFGALLPSPLAKRGLEVFTAFCSHLGITLKKTKSEVGPKITYLGLLGAFPTRGNGGRLTVSLTPEKAKKWSENIGRILKEQRISAHELEKLIGKLCFSQTCLFGKFARTQLRCLYRKLHAPRFVPNLSKAENLVLHWWNDVISKLSPRIPRGENFFPDFVLYTDAATLSNRIAAVLFRGNSSDPVVSKLTHSKVPNFWLRKFNSKNTIFGLEMLAPLAFLWENRELLKGKAINLYIDNNNVLTSLVRGDSGTDIIAAMIALFWRISESYQIDIWLGRVPSKRNPADLPTRSASLPFKVLKRNEFSGLFKLLTLTLDWAKRTT